MATEPGSIFTGLDPAASDYAVAAVDRLLETAISSNASDIHIQPRKAGWDVLFRIDGVLSVADWIRGGSAGDPVTRLMVLAGLPTYRSTQPMEGRLKWRDETAASNEPPSLRLSVFPTVHGPRAVLRVLRKDDRFDTLDSLGLDPKTTAKLKQLCLQTDGAILLSGPAGSGKTTTMYSMLRTIAAQRPRRSVITIEDPVESVIDSISQSELDPSGGMTLASALRSAVRQDSEVLLVSEIRDPETAEAAMQASLTGHLIFSSLHATDVAATLRRMIQFAVPSYALQSGIRAVVTQRLLRRCCDACRDDNQGNGDHPQGRNALQASDCQACVGTGYRGRVAVADCIFFDGSDPVGEALSRAIDRDASATQMRTDAIDAGWVDLRSQAETLAQQGITDMTEVYRVLGAN
ncbi:GspE/PulE family protein [Novipirellula caenicola]|uniref:Type II secretion system protein HxcR n=1 Tax=Novipirellula caenicola TaxID=1536901 RepID=A0ABP9VLW0_9BACT